MSRLAYVNGRFVPQRAAQVHIEDRGYQFADGVYEVIAFRHLRLIDPVRHFDRLDRSLAELRIANPMSRRALELVIGEVIRRNGLESGAIYLQLTRGVAPRDHGFPAHPSTQMVMTVKRLKALPASVVTQGVAVITTPDERWARCDIKSIALLANVLAKQKAREAGAFEAWLVDDEGSITEGCSSNAWIVTQEGEVVTHRADPTILNGVTRLDVVDLIGAAGLRAVQRAFTVAEARTAREAFLTSTTVGVLPVTRIDGHPVGEGKAGQITLRLRELLEAHRSQGPM